MITLSQFISKYLGKTDVSYDGVPADAGQCVQLVELYARDSVGAKLPLYAGAADYWEKGCPGYQKIARTWLAYPKAGDLVVWKRTLPGSEGYGHIDICIRDGSSSGFLGLDSNWSPLRVTEVNHNYNYVYGYLRHPKAAQAPTVPQYYTVVSGDTVSAICTRFKLTLTQFKALNPTITNINLIYAGQKVRIK